MISMWRPLRRIPACHRPGVGLLSVRSKYSETDVSFYRNHVDNYTRQRGEKRRGSRDATVRQNTEKPSFYRKHVGDTYNRQRGEHLSRKETIKRDKGDAPFGSRRVFRKKVDNHTHRRGEGLHRVERDENPPRQKGKKKMSKHDLKDGCISDVLVEEKTPVPVLDRFDVFVTCLPGLEPLLLSELLSMGIKPIPVKDDKNEGELIRFQQEKGGVSFKTKLSEDIVKCHLYLGTASRILLNCGEPFRARGMEELRRKISKMGFWREYLCETACGGVVQMPSFDVRVSVSKSRLFHTKGIAERIQGGIAKALGVDESNCHDKEEAQIILKVVVHRDSFQLHVDTSTTPLHRRGYRLATAKAPLREDLAFALLFSAGWPNGSTALLDPFCGAGTIVIEGAAMALGIAPGRLRPPPFVGSRLFDSSQWNRLVNEANKPRVEMAGGSLMLMGSDRDEGAVDASKSNADRAGVSHAVNFLHHPISSSPWLEDPTSAPTNVDDDSLLLVATNPPFGRRIRSKRGAAQENSNELLPLYQTLGHRVGRLGDKVRTAIIAHDVKLARRTGLESLSPVFSSTHGGLPIVGLVTK